MNDKLKKLLHKYRNKQFLVIKQGGNHGDKLIYMGIEKVLNELDITYKNIHLSKKVTIVYKLLLTMGKEINKLKSLNKYLN